MSSDRHQVIESGRVALRHEVDIAAARLVATQFAARAGFGTTAQSQISTAVSEIARNIVVYAGTGEILFQIIENGQRSGMEVVAIDAGPGIVDLDKAMQDGFSTRKTLGLGLPGARRLMDEFEIVSAIGLGTRVTMRKWRT